MTLRLRITKRRSCNDCYMFAKPCQDAEGAYMERNFKV
jgi:hypothetical protein